MKILAISDEESKALYDNLYPSRIIVGADMSEPKQAEAAKKFAGLLQEGGLKPDVEVLYMGLTEAEADTTLRISLCAQNTEEELIALCDALRLGIKMLARMKR